MRACSWWEDGLCKIHSIKCSKIVFLNLKCLKCRIPFFLKHFTRSVVYNIFVVSALKAPSKRLKGTLVVTIYICWKMWFDMMPCISGARSCFLPESRACGCLSPNLSPLLLLSPSLLSPGGNPGNIKKSINVLIPCPCPRNIDKCDTKI